MRRISLHPMSVGDIMLQPLSSKELTEEYRLVLRRAKSAGGNEQIKLGVTL